MVLYQLITHLSDLSVYYQIHLHLKDYLNLVLEIKVDSNFIDTFIKGKAALADTETFQYC